MNIYGIDGQPIIKNVKLNASCRHEEELMKSNFVKLYFRHSRKKSLPIGSFVEVDNIRYTLFDPYSPTQEEEDRFLYEPEFQHPIMWLAKLPFIHRQGNTTTWATTQKKFDWTFTGSPFTLATHVADYINWLGTVYPAFATALGTGWTARITQGLPATETFSFNSVDILSAAAEMANKCECEYHFDFAQRIFHFGTVSFLRAGDTQPVLKSGDNVGVASVSASREAYYNCFVVKGGTRNISQQSASGDNVQVTERLSLDKTKYPDSIIDVREGSGEPMLVKELLFDNIYPKMELYLYNPRERLCYLLDQETGEKIPDETDPTGYKTYSKWYIRLAYQKNGVWHDYTINTETDLIKDKPLSIAFQPNYESDTFTSPLTGREFELVYFDKITVEKEEDDVDPNGFRASAGDYRIIFVEGDVILPTTSRGGLCPKGNVYPSTENNKVTLFNVVVDEVYKDVAEDELEEAGLKAIERLRTDLNTYTVKSNAPLFAKEKPSLYVGQSVIYDDGQDLNNGTSYRLETHIRKIVTRLDFPEIVEISVGNEQIKGSVSSLREKVNSLDNGLIGGLAEDQFVSMLQIYGSRIFLSKEFNDIASGIITFLKGTRFGSYVQGLSGASINSWGDAEFRKIITRVGMVVKDLIVGNFAEGVPESGAHIDRYGNAELETLVTRALATLSSLYVQGDSTFGGSLSTPDFESGFPYGTGWAIQRVEVTNADGQKEYKYTLEIDNANIRNTLRVYEFIISQLLGENDNRIFTAMLEVDHYEPSTGKVWLSTNGGRLYNPFRVGDYIMVQQYQPGNDMASGGDGYITKHYEMIISDRGTGGKEDEDGNRLDWVKFYNWTPADGVSKPADLIAKYDTFCRVDSISDEDRKGIIQIVSVGQNAPYMDVIKGMKTNPNDSLKGRFGALTGIRTDLFGWLEGFGAYLNNLYAVGKFFNAQTGESLNARIEATKESMKSVYTETTYNISDEDNFLSNGFFQDELKDWSKSDTDGSSAPSASSEVGRSMGIAERTSSSQKTPLMLNGDVMVWKKDLRMAEIVEDGGIKVLHLNNLGITQDFSKIKENGTHLEMKQDYDGIVDDPTASGYVSPYNYTYDNNGNFVSLADNPNFQDLKDTATETKDVADTLYFGVRILPITDGTLTVRFKKSSSYTGFTRRLIAAHEWQLIQASDENEAVKWDYTGSGKLVVSYTGECKIRFVALMTEPIENTEINYKTLFKQTSRFLKLQAIKEKAGHVKAMGEIQVQHDAIMNTVTGNKNVSDALLVRLLGITVNPDGTYNIPDSLNGDNYATWRINTNKSINDIAVKWDKDGNLIGYSTRTQTADFIREVIAGTATHSTFSEWGDAGTNLIKAMATFKQGWQDSLEDGTIDAKERGYLESLRKAIKTQFNAAKAAYDKVKTNSLVADTTELSTLNTKWSQLNTAYSQFNEAVLDLLSVNGAIDVNGTHASLVQAVETKFDTFDAKMKAFQEALEAIGVKADALLLTKVNAVTTDFANYQTTLDNYIKEKYKDSTFLSWVSDTAQSSIQIKALLDANGNLFGYSTRQQTADDISSAVVNAIGVQGKTATQLVADLKALINTDVLSDGANGYGSFKTQTKSVIGSIVAEFNANGTIKTYTQWVQDAKGIKSTVSDLTGNVQDALNVIFDTTGKTFANADDSWGNQSWIAQNKSKILLAAGEFNNDGTLKESAGAVMSSNFASLFANAYKDENRDLLDARAWENGRLQSIATGKKLSEMTQNSDPYSIRTKNLIPINTGTTFMLGDYNYRLTFYFFGDSDKLVAYTDPLAPSNGRVTPTIRSSYKKCAIVVTHSANIQITTDNLSAMKLSISDTQVVTTAEISAFVKKTADGHLESGIKLYADQINITTIDQFSSNFSWGNMASKLNGEIEIAAKQITNFAEEWNTLAGNFTVNAKNISFSGEAVTWKIDKLWTIKNKNNATIMLLDQAGDLSITGTLKSGSVIETTTTIDGYQSGYTMLGHKINDITFPSSGNGNVYPTPKNHGLTHVITSAVKGGNKFINLPTLGECYTALGISSGSFCIRMVFMNQSNTNSSTTQGDLIYIRGRSGSAVENVTSNDVRPYVVNSSDVGNFQLTYSRIAEVFITRFGNRFVATYLIS